MQDSRSGRSRNRVATSTGNGGDKLGCMLETPSIRSVLVIVIDNDSDNPTVRAISREVGEPSKGRPLTPQRPHAEPLHLAG